MHSGNEFKLMQYQSNGRIGYDATSIFPPLSCGVVYVGVDMCQGWHAQGEDVDLGQ